MFSVLAVTAIATTLAGVAVVSATGTLTRTDREETREQALYLAEAAASRATTEMRATPSYNTTTEAPPQPVTRQWVLQKALTSPVENGREGQYSWVVPAAGSEVFGVGYVPSRAAPRELRILRLQVDRSNPFGDLSFLSAGTANMNGNVDIAVGGSIHSNVDLTLTGSASVTGNATATGAFAKGSAVDINGTFGGGHLPYDIPVVDPRSYRNLTNTDLCPDGTVRTTTPTTPCTGTVIGSGLVGWNGFTWVTGEWRIAGSSAGSGGFYVYQANMRLSGNVGLWNGALVVEGLSLNGTLINGDMIMTGTTTINPPKAGVAVVVSRDIVFSGNGVINGLTLAGEQVQLSGNATVNGQLISASQVSSPGSPVNQANLSGNVTLRAQVHAPAQDGGYAAVTWEEM